MGSALTCEPWESGSLAQQRASTHIGGRGTSEGSINKRAVRCSVPGLNGNSPNACGDHLRRSAAQLLQRYHDLSGYLGFPGDWGERPIRGWIMFEFFSIHLGWPANRVILGERFDGLFINSDGLPVICLETKKPGALVGERRIGTILKKAELLSRRYPTIQQVVLTDGKSWVRKDLLRGDLPPVELSIQSPPLSWWQFFRPLRCSEFP